MFGPQGSANASGIMRTLSRATKDSVRVGIPVLRVSDARYGCLMKYNLPLPKAAVAPVAPKAAPPASEQLQRASTPDDVVFVQPKAADPFGSEDKHRPRGAPVSP